MIVPATPIFWNTSVVFDRWENPFSTVLTVVNLQGILSVVKIGCEKPRTRGAASVEAFAWRWSGRLELTSQRRPPSDESNSTRTLRESLDRESDSERHKFTLKKQALLNSHSQLTRATDPPT